MSFSFSEDIQRGILYLLKSDLNFFHQIVNLVKEDYFEFPSHQKIFKAVNKHHHKYLSLPKDEFILEEVRGRLSINENLGDFKEELDFINKFSVEDFKNSEYYLDLIEEFAKTEEIKCAIRDSVILLKEGNIGGIRSRIEEALLVSRDVNIGQVYFNDIASRWDRHYNSPQGAKFKTILGTMTKNLEGGYSRKELVGVVASSGVGKSLYLVNQSVVSLTEGKKVLYISLEMSEDKIAARFDSIMTRIKCRDLKNPDSKLKLKERLDLFSDTFPGSQLVIKEFPTGQATVNTIRALLVQLRNCEDFEPDVIVVDYLELMRPERFIEAEYMAQQRIAEELRGLAVEKNILALTASQGNREAKKVKVITDSELAGSFGKIRVFDFCVSLNQTEEEYNEGKMRVHVMKARDSKTSYTMLMHVDYNTLVMQEAPLPDNRKADEEVKRLTGMQL